jgi:hypothetical protein
MLHDRPFTAAEAAIRRRANRHGHAYPIAPDGSIRDECPDPDAHARDVADMTMLLQMAGLAPYESVPRPLRGIAQLGSNFVRPRRSS